MKQYWLIAIFIASIAKAQPDAIQQSLNLENVSAASFYAKSITDPELLNLALVEIKILEGNYQGAISSLKEFRYHFKTPETEGRFWLLSGVAFHKNQQFNQADEAFAQALIFFKKSKEKIVWLAHLHFWKTLVLLEQNRLNEASGEAHTALGFFNRDSTQYYIKKAKLLLWLGGIKKGQGEFDSSKIYLLQALSHFQNSPLDKTHEIIKVHNNLANVYAAEWELCRSNKPL